MFLSLAYSVFALGLLLFCPDLIDKIPVGELWMKQLIFAGFALFGWAVVSLYSIQSGR